LLLQQIECTIDQIALNLFKKAQSLDPTLEDTLFQLHMQKEVLRVEEKIALQST